MSLQAGGGAPGTPAGRTVRLGGGIVVPYPEPRDAAATKIGKANKRTGTRPEMKLRSALHHRGLRFRKDFLIRTGTIKVRADVVFTRVKVVVFLDGCFWHGCPQHQHIPKTNTEYWIPKLRRNVERDRAVDIGLVAGGWAVIRAWEHEEPSLVADSVAEMVERRRQLLDPRSGIR